MFGSVSRHGHESQVRSPEALFKALSQDPPDWPMPGSSGRYEFQSGAVYDGDWLNGSRHGMGKQASGGLLFAAIVVVVLVLVAPVVVLVVVLVVASTR